MVGLGRQGSGRYGFDESGGANAIKRPESMTSVTSDASDITLISQMSLFDAQSRPSSGESAWGFDKEDAKFGFDTESISEHGAGNSNDSPNGYIHVDTTTPQPILTKNMIQRMQDKLSGSGSNGGGGVASDSDDDHKEEPEGGRVTPTPPKPSSAISSMISNMEVKIANVDFKRALFPNTEDDDEYEEVNGFGEEEDDDDTVTEGENKDDKDDSGHYGHASVFDAQRVQLFRKKKDIKDTNELTRVTRPSTPPPSFHLRNRFKRDEMIRPPELIKIQRKAQVLRLKNEQLASSIEEMRIVAQSKVDRRDELIAQQEMQITFMEQLIKQKDEEIEKIAPTKVKRWGKSKHRVSPKSNTPV